MSPEIKIQLNLDSEKLFLEILELANRILDSLVHSEGE